MKDVIRRGVERQVAEGMFERAQERMQHQFQQLKVSTFTVRVLVPRRPWGVEGASAEGGRNSRHWAQVQLGAFALGPRRGFQCWKRRPLMLSDPSSLPPSAGTAPPALS